MVNQLAKDTNSLLSFWKIPFETFNLSRERFHRIFHKYSVNCDPKTWLQLSFFSFVPLNSIECLTRPINIDEFELPTRFSLFFSVKSWSFSGLKPPEMCFDSTKEDFFPFEMIFPCIHFVLFSSAGTLHFRKEFHSWVLINRKGTSRTSSESQKSLLLWVF